MALLLPQDIARLRIDFEEKFAQRPTYAYVVGDMLRRLDEEVWNDEQGVPQETAINLNRIFAPALESVLSEHDPSQIHAAVDRLVCAWWQVVPLIKLA